MKSHSKKVRRLLREWCDIAYHRELDAELAKLHDQFHLWDTGKLSPFDLSDAIHKFHDGPARELYVRYVMSRGGEDWLLAAAVVAGSISKEELPGELLEALKAGLSE